MRIWIAAILFFPLACHAQPVFVFATLEEARAVLGAKDDYVLATSPLERAAKTHSAEAVDEDHYRSYLQSTALGWTPEQRAALQPVLARLEQTLSTLKRPPSRLLLVRASDALEDGLPHTRADAIVLTPMAFDPRSFPYILSHEIFHVLTRRDPALRESLYAAIGFRPCERVEIPEAVSRLRITNPDIPESRHTIRVAYGGAAVEALPYLRLEENADPRQGFQSQMQSAWLLVDREGGRCSARTGTEEFGVDPKSLSGLYEQIGRNTEYLFHAEEILADNFAIVLLSAARGTPSRAPSPEVLEKVRTLMFR